VQILSRRTKNNPVLIGEAGVGKTAIVEGLAQRIIKKHVPDILTGRRIVMLDLGAIVAGTKYRGQFEERLKGLMKETMDNPNIILFIDELHTLVGAGAPKINGRLQPVETGAFPRGNPMYRGYNFKRIPQIH